MIKIEHSQVINRPIEEVFDFVTDIEKAPQWRAGVVESKKLSDEPKVGAKGSEVLQFMGRRIDSTYEITEYEPSTKFGFKVISGPIPMEGGYSFESVESGTKLAFTIQGRCRRLLQAVGANPPPHGQATGRNRPWEPEGPAGSSGVGGYPMPLPAHWATPEDFATLFQYFWHRDFPASEEAVGARRTDWTMHTGIVVHNIADLMGLFARFERGGRKDAILRSGDGDEVAIEWAWQGVWGANELGKLKTHKVWKPKESSKTTLKYAVLIT